MATTTTTTTAQLVQQMLEHRAPRPTFSFTPFLQNTYNHGLPPDRPICKAYAAGHCPLGTRCPDRHVASSTSKQEGGGGSTYNSLVCKHWLRGLCKKGESCEFLHEYNVRKMPECNFFVRNGYCSNGDECLYLHIDPQSKLPPCPHYEQGFCPLGPRCSKKHVRKKLCPYYLAGFCPNGKTCKEGAHPRWEKDLEKPTAKVEKKEDDESVLGKREHIDDEDDGMIRERGDRDRGGHDRGGHKDRFGGGRGGGGRWRGKPGGHKFRGRH